jgi:hypothetical protein
VEAIQAERVIPSRDHKRSGFVEVFLNRRRRIWNVVLVGGILALGFVGCSKQGVTARANAEATPATTQSPAQNMWVSKTTGKHYRVTVGGETFRAEWVNVPSEWAAHGAFMRTECKRQGSMWVGTSLSFMPWSPQKGTKAKAAHWCRLETKFEVDAINADSIIGRGENVKKLDYQKCQILDSGMATFLWTPDR